MNAFKEYVNRNLRQYGMIIALVTIIIFSGLLQAAAHLAEERVDAGPPERICAHSRHRNDVLHIDRRQHRPFRRITGRPGQCHVGTYVIYSRPAFRAGDFDQPPDRAFGRYLAGLLDSICQGAAFYRNAVRHAGFPRYQQPHPGWPNIAAFRTVCDHRNWFGSGYRSKHRTGFPAHRRPAAASEQARVPECDHVPHRAWHFHRDQLFSYWLAMDDGMP